MTALVRWLRKTRDKWLGRWDEGPESPARLRELARAFAVAHPHATRDDWARFAADHACEAYRVGYMRGLEWAEREPDRWRPHITPEEYADLDDPSWRLSQAVDLTPWNGAEEVPAEYSEERVMADHLVDTVKVGR
jgi:hypothetical protein